MAGAAPRPPAGVTARALQLMRQPEAKVAAVIEPAADRHLTPQTELHQTTSVPLSLMGLPPCPRAHPSNVLEATETEEGL